MRAVVRCLEGSQRHDCGVFWADGRRVHLAVPEGPVGVAERFSCFYIVGLVVGCPFNPLQGKLLF